VAVKWFPCEIVSRRVTPAMSTTALSSLVVHSCNVHACKGVNLAGILGDAGLMQKAWWGEKYGVRSGYIFPPEEGYGEGAMPHPQKKMNFSLGMACFGAFSAVLFCPCPCQKNVEFSARSGDLVDIENVPLGNSEYSVSIMGLISFFFYCITAL